jgi:hypothetical protein
MATLPTQLNPVRRLAALTLALAVVAGCASTEKVFDGPPAPSSIPPCQVVSWWEPQVFWTPDPVRNGALNPTLAGRVYLSGPEFTDPQVGDGTLTVSLYEGNPPPSAEVQPIEIWQIDAPSLRKYLKKDAIGWGYTVCLPWSTYRKDLTSVQMRVRYDGGNAQPLFAENSPVALSHDPNAASPPIVQGTRNPFNGLPAAAVPVAMGPKP